MLQAETEYYFRRDIDSNYAALAYAICCPKLATPEECVNRIVARAESGRRREIDSETREMIRLRETGYTYKEISEITRVSPSAVWARIKRGR